jgi:hypothetical protein
MLMVHLTSIISVCMRSEQGLAYLVELLNLVVTKKYER